VVWKHAIEQHYSTKHASIELLALLMIRRLEWAAMGKIRLLNAAVMPA
jgi:hypothetical protein